jgi:hypothetical protein
MACHNTDPNVFTIIKEFEGIIGALLGLIVGSFLTYLNQAMGRIYFSVDNYKFELGRYIGGRLDNEVDVDHCQWAKYTFEGYFFNNTNISKGFRDFKVIFKNKDFYFGHEPNDLDTIKYPDTGFVTSYSIEKFDIITFIPKQYIRKRLEGRIEKTDSTADIEKIMQCPKVYLSAIDHKNKAKTWIIKS